MAARWARASRTTWRSWAITDVVLLEREALASGSTSKSAGGIRAQFADDLNVKIALRSMAEFQALERVSGIEYKRHGYLFLLDDEVDVEGFQTRSPASRPRRAVAADLAGRT